MIDLVFIYRYQGEPFMRKVKSMYSAPGLGERVQIRHEPGMKLVYAVHSVDWVFENEGPVEVHVLLS